MEKEDNRILLLEKGKRKLIQIVFGRTGIIIVSLIVQILFLFAGFRYLEGFLPYFWGGSSLLSAAVVLSFMATMFLTWIHNTDKIIVGVQGRYFIPILPLLMLSLNNKIVVLRKNIDRGMTVLAILLSARTVLAILDFTMFNV